MSVPPRIFIYQYGEAALLKNYVAALTAAGAECVIRAAIEESCDCDGLLLPGGGDSDPKLYGQENLACREIDLDRDEKELALVKRFCVAGKPILGICRGHQLLNIAFGGDLIQDMETAALHTQCNGAYRHHETTIAADSMLHTLYGGEMIANSAHHQAVGKLGEGLRAVQWTEDGAIEALEHRELPIFGVQWHPERQTGAWRRENMADGAALFSWFTALCIEKSEKTGGRKHHGKQPGNGVPAKKCRKKERNDPKGRK